MSLSWLAVPSVTVLRIMSRNAAVTSAGRVSDGVSAVTFSPSTRLGRMVEPCARLASATASPNGLTVTVPWPMPFSTRWAAVSAPGTRPVTVVSPGMVKSTPIRTRGRSWSAHRRAACPTVPPCWCCTKWENADAKGTVPRSKSSSLGMVRFSMVNRPGQATGVSGVARSASSAAAVVMVLNVEPGG
ncbi:Uncharacterised protein [Mycolicibacterium fortuitum]|uniref:Uncharacterized protein n=1 Tax=Mycolicibacterium fortuitum TaxID=1766 RepID=A0A378UXD9_MYCFO|nr:Uncharacterised protein [Mycolicibacterium fortuitum]